MLPKTKDLIITLHNKGLCEEEIYRRLQGMEGDARQIMPHQIFEVLNEYRLATSFMQKPEGGGCARIFGLLCFLGGSAFVILRMTVYAHVNMGKRDPGGYALLLAVLGLILIFKPHAKLEE